MLSILATGLKDALTRFPGKQTVEELGSFLTGREREFFERNWQWFAHPQQLPPRGPWRTWLMLGGRGAGKTRAGAEWVQAVASRKAGVPGNAAGRIALVGETFHDVRHVMIEGESGLMAIAEKSQLPEWHPSLRRLEWPNGTIGQVFSASDPDGLRGNQFGLAWSDELAKWPDPETAWNMLQFCLRLGTAPRQLVTTTPRPIRLLKKLLADPQTQVTQASTRTNSAHLAEGFIDYLESEYAGTRLGKQEIEGAIVEGAEGALWTLDAIDALRVKCPPALDRVVVAVDPPASSGPKADACGIIAVGKATDGICYVIADATIEGAAPETWAHAVSALYRKLNADCVVAETNQGGEMVRSILEIADPALPVRMVRATRGKWLRAEPVALLYVRGRVRHVGNLEKLEAQMCDFTPDGQAGGRSPDRLDALVWAIHELALKNRAEPKIRTA